MYVIKSLPKKKLLKMKCIKQKPVFIFMLYSLMTIFNVAQAELYKCKDNDGSVIYSDRACFNTKSQNLDIVVSPVDQAAASRLRERMHDNKNYKNKKYNNKTSSKVKIVKTEKKSMECQSYIDYIKNNKRQLNSGYTNRQGDTIQKSIDRYSKLYDKNCK